MDLDRRLTDKPRSGADFWRKREIDVFGPRKSPGTIDHIPGEKRFGNGIWWVLWIAVIVGWIGYLALIPIDWRSVSLGAFTTFVALGFAVERAGPSWFQKPPSR